MERFTEEYRARFAALSTTNVSDAMDALGIHGATYGIRPMWHTMEKVLGPAITLKMTAAGQTKGKYHLGVRAIDAAEPGDVIVVDNGGRIDTGLDALAWAERVCTLGAGEILLTSMDRDGSRDGFDCHLTRSVARAVDIPVIASGGVGKLEHFAEGIIEGEADAVLAASVFHFGELTVRQVKESMRAAGIPVRL